MNAPQHPPIPFVDLKAQYRRIKAQVDANIQAVLDHGQFIMGPEVGRLETALASYAGCRHAVAVSSGTDALVVALMALGVGPGDIVFLPGFTYTATAEVVLLLGATPAFVDVDPRTFNMDPADLERRAAAATRGGGGRPRAVIAVDLFGLPADYPALASVCQSYDLSLIADGAQSFGGSLNGRRVGSLAPVTTTSFFPAKPLGCYGDGGAVLTDDTALASLMSSIRQHGKGGGKYDIVRLGINGRLDALQAAVLLAKLEIFDDELAARDRLARTYDSALAEHATTPLRPAAATSAWAQYSILLHDRDEVARRLKAAGVSTAVYYPRPMHHQPAYARFAPDGGLPVSEALCERILSLPMHPYLSETTALTICQLVIDACADPQVQRRSAEL